MTNEQSEKLLPCPFCGESNITWESRPNREYMSHEEFNVICTRCRASTDRMETKEIAIDKWNVRQPAPDEKQPPEGEASTH